MAAPAISEAIAHGDHKLVIPPETYSFRGDTKCFSNPANVNQWSVCNPAWTIGVSDLDIDFSGSILKFNTPGI